jgi:hypothetical protein
MNTNQQHESDDPLRKVLHQWVVDSPLPPRFQEQVWQRIAKAEKKPEAALWPAILRLIEVALPRPKFAFVYMAALLVLGVAAGSWTAQIKTNRLHSDLSLRYVQSIDPYRADSSNQ